MDPYHRRVIDDELDELLLSLPAIAIDGPKAVGKTATAVQRAATVHRLDTISGAAVAQASPDRLVDGPYPVLIDEWQRFPPSWDLVRRAVDADAARGRFLLTGSASPANLTIHSGAGRIVSLRMRPMSLAERFPGKATVSLASLLRGDRAPIEGTTDARLEHYVAEIVGSGLPGIRRLEDRGRRHALDAYIEQLAHRDIEEAGQVVRRPATLLRWMTAYAAATATTTSLSVIRAAASGTGEAPPSKTTVLPYHDALQRLWFVDPVPAWQPTRNPFRRSTGAPKHHLADPALAARLLGTRHPRSDASRLRAQRFRPPVLCSDRCPPRTLAGDPPCPPAVGDPRAGGLTPRSAPVRRPFDAIAPDAGTRSRPRTPGRPRSRAGPSTGRGGTRTARTPTRRRSSSSRPTARTDADPVAIVPLMHRHEVEPGDVELRTKMRGADGPPLTPVPPDAKAVFFGASYHADYATLLAHPRDLPAAATALAEYCAGDGDPTPPAAVGRGRPPPAAVRRSGAATRWRPPSAPRGDARAGR